MKKTMRIPLILLFIVGLHACGTSGNSQAEANSDNDGATTPTPEDVSDLTIMDLFALIYPDSTGTPLEWHGEALPNDLTEYLVISEGESCGDQGCGRQLLMTNTADRAIGLMTKADFSIRDRQAYLACEFILDAGQTLSIGCSHLCFNGESFPFSRSIVGSWYMDE